MVMAGQMFGKRPVGKPKKRCMNAVKEEILKWRNWEVKAEDRDECRSRIKSPRPALGCSAIDVVVGVMSNLTFL
jgi:hypothetical protein